MRITVSVPEQLAEEARRAARSDAISVSRLFADALEFYLRDARRRRLGNEVIALIGAAGVSDDALDILEEGRADDRA